MIHLDYGLNTTNSQLKKNEVLFFVEIQKAEISGNRCINKCYQKFRPKTGVKLFVKKSEFYKCCIPEEYMMTSIVRRK